MTKDDLRTYMEAFQLLTRQLGSLKNNLNRTTSPNRDLAQEYYNIARQKHEYAYMLYKENPERWKSYIDSNLDLACHNFVLAHEALDQVEDTAVMMLELQAAEKTQILRESA